MTRSVVGFGISSSVDVESVFATAIAESHHLATRVDVLLDGDVLPVTDLAVTRGTVIVDRTHSIQGSCSVSIADPVRVPVAADDVLTPYGYELQVWRGISVLGGQIMAPLGVFPIQRSSVDGTTLLSEIVARDRSQLVSDALFEDTYQVASGTNYATAIEALISDGVSGLEFLFPDTTHTTPTLTFGGDDDRWAAARQMARSLGNELLFDGLGRCVMRAEPSFQSEPVGAIAEGVNMIDALVKLDRGPAVNKVIATSANASLGDQFRGEAVDDDPASPTYYSGPFGKKVRRHVSPFYASDGQCAAGAAAILKANLGVARAVSAKATVDPRRETSDVIRVKRESLGLNDELHIVDRVTMGLAPESTMTAKVRAQQVAS